MSNYSSDFDVRLATLGALGGDTTKHYDSVYDIDIEILALTQQGGVTENRVKEIVEGYGYATESYVTTSLVGYCKVVSLTQAEYDALATKSATTLYVITDAE